ncbi:MAG: PqqD family protein [Actinobacteria bacterium]|nr:PqqD family protein [Actinomycetota bacterium]
MGDGDLSSEPTETRLSLRPEALDWVDVEEEVVVLDSDRSIYLATNPSGAVLWRRLIEGATQRDLEVALVEAFEISHDRAAVDVATFVDQLHSLGLLASQDG